MPVSALVLTLQNQRFDETYARLLADTRLQVGEPNGVHVPVVLEAQTLGAARDLSESMAQMTGVEAVRVVVVDFSDLES